MIPQNRKIYRFGVVIYAKICGAKFILVLDGEA
jgi:hypothetical protein